MGIAPEVVNEKEATQAVAVRAAEQNGSAMALAESGKSIRVRNQEDAGQAAAMLKRIVDFKKSVEDDRKSFTRPLDAIKKAIKERFDGVIRVAEEAEMHLRREINTFTTHQREVAAKLQAKALADAEKKVAKIEEKIAVAEASGNLAKVEQLMEKQAAVSAPVITAPKIEGLRTVGRWTAKVVDKAAFLAHVGNDATLLDAVEVSESKLSAVGRQTGGKAIIPGVKFTFVEKEGL
jgi:lysozyme family protein